MSWMNQSIKQIVTELIQNGMVQNEEEFFKLTPNEIISLLEHRPVLN